jgi:SNF2 family DNA or RNA helicase
LEEHLKARRISYLRIDGNATDAARLRILQDFRDNDGPVLLMTVGTGAVGSATHFRHNPRGLD